MLTSSGISNTRASYLDVARTLGASHAYLIFRVAIPAAMPNIFIGLFMGLGASFLTLVVAEKDPGFGNWIDTTGHTSGTALLRWVGTDHHPLPTCKVVTL